jgi:dephospho-CoA kinase
MQPDGFARLEALIHPLVKEKRLQFLEQHRQSGSKMVVLDIPLLFEKHMEDSVDVILLVTASRETQRERAMKRPGMSPDKLEMILAHQMPDEEKRRRADFVVDTSGSFEETHAKLDQFLESVQN